MATMWTLVLIWMVGGDPVQTMAVSNIPSAQACVAVRERVLAQLSAPWTPPTLALCIQTIIGERT